MKRRAIYIGQPYPIKVPNGERTPALLTFGMTGEYVDGTFIPDDKGVPASTVNESMLYFPTGSV